VVKILHKSDALCSILAYGEISLFVGDINVAETPTILLTSADIQNIENEQTRLNSEIAALEAKLPELHARRGELGERLTKINSLLDALGLGSVSELSSNSVYAARHVRTVPNGHGSENGAAV